MLPGHATAEATAMTRAPGTRCVLREYTGLRDGPCLGEEPLPAGDFLRTEHGSCYRIDEVRESRSEHILAVYICTRLDHDAVQFGDDGVWGWRWARRPRQALPVDHDLGAARPLR
jgi:hypothetical protein